MVKQTKNGHEQFDGLPVQLYEGKFSGNFDIEEDLGKKLSYDDEVTFIVTARVGGNCSFGETKQGDIKRVNTFKISGIEVFSTSESTRIPEPEYDTVTESMQALEDSENPIVSRPTEDLDGFFAELDEEEPELYQKAPEPEWQPPIRKKIGAIEEEPIPLDEERPRQISSRRRFGSGDPVLEGFLTR